MTWDIDQDSVDPIAIGATLLGTGGGGDAHLARLHLGDLLRRGKRVQVISADDLDDDDIGCAVSGMGAPTVSIEKLPAGDEIWQAARSLQDRIHQQFGFIAIGEIGGGNAIEALIAGAYSDLPVVDADPMGRAFPELQMDTFMINGVKPSPFALADGFGSTAVMHVPDPASAERFGRALTTAMGGSAALALPIIRGDEVNRFGIHNTLSLCWNLGKAIRDTAHQHNDLMESIREYVPACLLFFGKIVDVDRRTTGSFAKGVVTIDGLEDFSASRMTIDIQNEFLIARQGTEIVATVPDLICAIDAEDSMPIGTESLRYGLRLHIVGIPASAKLKTRSALDTVGPSAFGYDMDYQTLHTR